jgi:hypothetical protein
VDSPVRAVNHGDGIEINLGNFTERPRELDE